MTRNSGERNTAFHASIELRLPHGLALREQLTRFERAEATIDSRADEDHASGGRNAAAEIQRAGLVEALGLQRMNFVRNSKSLGFSGV